jgi:glycosyltransferase involved in cell wall biosynthesis
VQPGRGIIERDLPDSGPREDADALRARLVEEIDRRRERDRDLVEQRARADAAEAELANVRLTLSFGLGHALVQALTWRGLLRLPGRLSELRRRQAAKRGRLPGRYVGVRPADAMRLVGEARERLRREDAAAVRDWILSQGVAPAEKARALADLAIAIVADQPQAALAIGLASAEIKTAEPRLFTLAVALHEAGFVSGPLDLLDRLAARLSFSEAMAQHVAAIRAEAAPLPVAGDVRLDREPPRGGTVVLVAQAALDAGNLDALRASEVAAAAGAGASVVAVAGDGAIGAAIGDAGVVHLIGADIAAAAAARRRGARVILDIATLPRWALANDGRERSVIAAARVMAALRSADAVVVRSAEIGRVVARLAPDVLPILIPAVIAPVAASEDRLTDLRRELDLRPDRPVVVCAAGLDDDPGLFDLVDAVADLVADTPELTLLFVGTGPAAPALARAAARRDISRNVLFSGAFRAVDLPAYLALGGVAVFPRRGPASCDTSPAMAFAGSLGLPRIASAAEWGWRGEADAAPAALAEDRSALRTAIDRWRGRRLAPALGASPRPGLAEIHATIRQRRAIDAETGW